MIDFRRRSSQRSETIDADKDDNDAMDQLETIALPEQQEQMITEKSSPQCPAKPMDFEELEKYWAVQDKWRLVAWGIKQKQSLTFRLHFLTATEHLKDKFRIILGRFLSRRAQREFEQMEELIKNFDLGSLDSKDSK